MSKILYLLSRDSTVLMTPTADSSRVGADPGFLEKGGSYV